MSIEEQINAVKGDIENAARNVGLDFTQTIFELVDANEMNAIAAYGGFPNRYPHWRFGMEYEHLSKTYTYGFSKIYELVINNDPCYAYLLRSNSFVDQKLVMAHVYGHADFFKNNVFFDHTNRKMMDVSGNHRSRIQRLMLRHGQDTVEDFIDLCLSVENLIDINQPMRSVDDETFSRPSRDVLLFLLAKAPLNSCQKEVLELVREEAYYFIPQKRTKIMNEGWASYWHSQLMTQGILDDDEVIDYADRHSGTMHTKPGSLNPYKLGLELFRDIEERWDQGRFGDDFEACDSLHEKQSWDKKTGVGRKKIFQVRQLDCDVSFLDHYLTPEFCEAQQLYSYAFNPKTQQYEIESRDFNEVKKKLLQTLTNGGDPVIEVVPETSDGELKLKHVHEGIDLKLDFARETMRSLQQIWQGPIHLETVVEEIPKTLTFDGKEHREHRMS